MLLDLSQDARSPCLLAENAQRPRRRMKLFSQFDVLRAACRSLRPPFFGAAAW